MAGLKTLEFSQFARIASTPRRLLGAVEEGTELICDEFGRLITVNDFTNAPGLELQFLSAFGTYIPSAGVIVSPTKVTLTKLSGYSDCPTPSFFQIFFANALPISGVTIPSATFPLKAGPGSYIPDILNNGVLEGFGGVGLVFALSSTQFIFTDIGTAYLYALAAYQG